MDESLVGAGASTGVAETQPAVAPSVATTMVQPSPQRRLAPSGPAGSRRRSLDGAAPASSAMKAPRGAVLSMGDERCCALLTEEMRAAPADSYDFFRETREIDVTFVTP